MPAAVTNPFSPRAASGSYWNTTVEKPDQLLPSGNTLSGNVSKAQTAAEAVNAATNTVASTTGTSASAPVTDPWAGVGSALSQHVIGGLTRSIGSDQSSTLSGIQSWFSGLTPDQQSTLTPFIGQASQAIQGFGSAGAESTRFENTLEALANPNAPSPFHQTDNPLGVPNPYGITQADFPGDYMGYLNALARGSGAPGLGTAQSIPTQRKTDAESAATQVQQNKDAAAATARAQVAWDSNPVTKQIASDLSGLEWWNPQLTSIMNSLTDPTKMQEFLRAYNYGKNTPLNVEYEDTPPAQVAAEERLDPFLHWLGGFNYNLDAASASIPGSP